MHLIFSENEDERDAIFNTCILISFNVILLFSQSSSLYALTASIIVPPYAAAQFRLAVLLRIDMHILVLVQVFGFCNSSFFLKD